MITGGFFSKEEVSSTQTLGRVTGCSACGLYKDCQSPKIPPSGKGEKGILILTDSPTKDEDSSGRAHVGGSGSFLRKKLSDQGIDLDRDCRTVFSVCCRTPKKKPTQNEIVQCRPRVWKEITDFKPHIILVMGSVAVNSFFTGRWKKGIGDIHKWRGWRIPDRELGSWVCPIFNPKYVTRVTDPDNRREYNPAVDVIFSNDLKKAIKLLEEDFPKFLDDKKFVHIVDSQRELCEKISGLIELGDLISWDVEATGLKLHAPGHRIVSMSISPDEHSAWAFVMPPEGSKARALLKQLMALDRVRKMAHNIKYEDNAWNVRGRGVVRGWFWDSMVAAHCLDNRPGITSLKFQAYVLEGVLPYDEHIEKFLKSSDEDVKKYGGNAFNRIGEIPIEDLLIYNGLDSLYEYRIALKQMQQMGVSRHASNI